jgi:hypothetical protein
VIGAQPGGGRGDFAGLAEAVQWDVAGDLGPDCLAGALQVWVRIMPGRLR